MLTVGIMACRLCSFLKSETLERMIGRSGEGLYQLVSELNRELAEAMRKWLSIATWHLLAKRGIIIRRSPVRVRPALPGKSNT
jgi:hypothetical protein